MFPDQNHSAFYGDDSTLLACWIPSLHVKLAKLSEFVREIKVAFARYFNKRYQRRGYIYGDPFKSVIAENGETLINCLAYIDLKPLRVGLVDRPEEFRWNSVGYHFRTGNSGNFLSTDFGLKEFNVKSDKTRIHNYRRYLYETGTLNDPGKGQARRIDNDIIEHERKKNYKISRADWFRSRTRYFTDSGIIGTKEFVSSNYKRLKGLFMSKREKIPRQAGGMNGI